MGLISGIIELKDLIIKPDAVNTVLSKANQPIRHDRSHIDQSK